MTSKELESILDEAICIDLNYPHFMLIFNTKLDANFAQQGLFNFFGKNELALILEYQEHTVTLRIYDVVAGNDVVINIPLCLDEKSDWFDNRPITKTKVSLFCGYGKEKIGSTIQTNMADFIEGLDEAGIRNINHFTAKRV